MDGIRLVDRTEHRLGFGGEGLLLLVSIHPQRVATVDIAVEAVDEGLEEEAPATRRLGKLIDPFEASDRLRVGRQPFAGDIHNLLI